MCMCGVIKHDTSSADTAAINRGNGKSTIYYNWRFYWENHLQPCSIAMFDCQRVVSSCVFV